MNDRLQATFSVPRACKNTAPAAAGAEVGRTTVDGRRHKLGTGAARLAAPIHRVLPNVRAGTINRPYVSEQRSMTMKYSTPYALGCQRYFCDNDERRPRRRCSPQCPTAKAAILGTPKAGALVTYRANDDVLRSEIGHPHVGAAKAAIGGWRSLFAAFAAPTSNVCVLLLVRLRDTLSKSKR